MKNRINIDELFQSSFKDFGDAPSKSVWEGMEQDLLKSNKQIIKINNYRKGLMLMGSLLFLTCSSLLLQYFVPTIFTTTTTSSSLSSSSTLSHTINSATKLINEEEDISNIVVLLDKKHKNLTISNEGTSYKNHSLSAATNSLMKGGNSLMKGSNKSITVQTKGMKSLAQPTRLPTQQSDKNSVSNNLLIDKSEIVYRESIHQFIDKDLDKAQQVIEKPNQVHHSIGVVNQQVSTIGQLPNPKTPSLVISNLVMPEKVYGSEMSVQPFKPLRNHFYLTSIIRYSYSGKRLKGAKEELGFYKLHESGSTAWSYGLKVGKDLTRHWSIESGFILQNHHIISNQKLITKYVKNGSSTAMLFTSFNTSNLRFNIENIPGKVNGDILSLSSKIDQAVRWIEIPIMASYNFRKSNYLVQISNGLTANVFLDDQLLFIDMDDKVSNVERVLFEDVGRFHWAYRGEINFHMLAFDHLDLYFGVHYQTALSSINNSKSIMMYPELYGLQVGGVISL